MFNLLMGFQHWEGSTRGTAMLSRIFEFTEQPVGDRFKDNGVPAFSRLSEYPCLFMHEGTNDEEAHVGSISRARIVGRDVAFEYALDPEVPPLLNSMIFANKEDFDMFEDFEFSRTHWAVKEVDLYRVLLRLVRPRRQRPVVFTIGEHERIEAELVSVMMPFDAKFNGVYESIQRAAADADLRCRRVDEIWEAPAIIQDIASLIDRSRIVICDCIG